MHFYITGDTHGNFSRIAAFCRTQHTTREDVLIILGDVGLNYFLDERDKRLKEKVAALNITLFCIHGNHEARPWEAEGYEEKPWMGARVYAEAAFPNLLFAKDGEIYTMRGKRVLAIGGAYSVDKEYRLSYGYRWFESEQPSEEIKAYTERQLKAADWRVDYVLSHTVPLDFEPVWSFLPGLDQSKVDKSTERWLQTLHDRLEIREGWYAGHYHCCCEGNGLCILFEDYGEICLEEEAMNIREELFALRDEGYAAFQQKLIPGVSAERVIGVRVPELRKLAKRYYKDPEQRQFLRALPHGYYDEDLLHALLIAEEKDFARCLEETEAFLPFIDNWAVCDIFSPKVFAKHKEELLERLRIWAKSEQTYTCRFGIGMLMQHFLDADFDAAYLEIPAAVQSEEYYVNMMLAWFFATALAKQWEATIPYLENKRLARWTHNKTIQKARESYRISAAEKEYLKSLKC